MGQFDWKMEIHLLQVWPFLWYSTYNDTEENTPNHCKIQLSYSQETILWFARSILSFWNVNIWLCILSWELIYLLPFVEISMANYDILSTYFDIIHDLIAENFWKFLFFSTLIYFMLFSCYFFTLSSIFQESCNSNCMFTRSARWGRTSFYLTNDKRTKMFSPKSQST